MTRWILRATAAGAAVLILVGVALLAWLDPNDFKPDIMAAVRDNTGRELRIAGDLKLEFFPYLAVTTGPLELGNAPGFEGPFLTVEAAHLKARLLPLLFSRLEVVAMDLDTLILRLSRDEHGRGNWMDLAAPAEPTYAVGSLASLRRDKRVPLVASLIVDGLRVSEASLVWRDRLDGRALDVGGIGIDVSDFAFGKPFSVQSRASALVEGIAAELRFKTLATLDLDRLAVEDLHLTAQLSSPRLPRGPETLSATVDFFSTDGRLENARVQGLGVDARAWLHPAANATVAGRLILEDCAPKDVGARLGLDLPELADSSSLARLALTCDWAAARNRLDVSGLQLRVDNSTLDGRISVVGRDKPVFDFDLHVDRLDADRYRPVSGDPKSFWPDVVRALRGLRANGTMAVDSATVAKLRVSDARFYVRAANGQTHLDRIEAALYGGRLEASAGLDWGQDTPQLWWSHTVDGLRVGPFLRDVHGRELLSGTASSSARLRARGVNAADVLQSLRGSLDFKVVDGVVHGINVAEMVRSELRKLKGQDLGPDEPDVTQFSVISGSGDVAGGVETTRDFLFLAPRFKVTGGGRTFLRTQEVDFDAVLTLAGSAGAFEEGAFGLKTVPVHVSGTVRDPKVSLDFAGLLRGMGAKGGRAVKDALEGIGSGVNRGVQGLKNIFE